MSLSRSYSTGIGAWVLSGRALMRCTPLSCSNSTGIGAWVLSGRDFIMKSCLKETGMAFVAQSVVAAVGDLYHLDRRDLTVGIRQYDIRSFS
jgi:hypothetical protein